MEQPPSRTVDSITVLNEFYYNQVFAVLGPATWNSLPVELWTQSLSSQTFAKENFKINYSADSASEDFLLTGAIQICIFIHPSIQVIYTKANLDPIISGMGNK